ncbi:MAG TPA: hypothetical protein VGC76_11965 [Pyrinomonadaceae bacterium]|jgi:hypothetical protein
MYRRPKFQEILLKIRQDMSRESDYDVDLFAEMVRSGKFLNGDNVYDLSENKENSSEKGKRENPKSET